MPDSQKPSPKTSQQAPPPGDAVANGKQTAEVSSEQPLIAVEVAFAKPDLQVIVPLEVPPGTTAAEAIQRSELAARFPELEPLVYKYGIFGKVCKPDQALRNSDRVEIYRPLIADPKQVRKDRAAKGKKTRKGAKAIGKAPTAAGPTATPAPAPSPTPTPEPAEPNAEKTSS